MTATVALAAFGDVDGGVLAAIARGAVERLGLPVSLGTPLPLPGYAWQTARAGYDAWPILDRLEAERRRAGAHLLAVIDADLFFAPFTFIFGSARVRQRVALVGLARLRPEFYGMAPDLEVLQARARKEALHELGHTFGLMHCRDGYCVMGSSPWLRDVDAKTDEWCGACAADLQRALPAAMRSSR